MAFNLPCASQTDSEIGVGFEFLPFQHIQAITSRLNLNAADHFAYEGNNHNGSDASLNSRTRANGVLTEYRSSHHCEDCSHT